MRTLWLLALLPIILSTDDLGENLRLGDAAYSDFRTRDAISYYTRALQSQPDSYDALSRLARAWSDLGRLALRRSDSSETYYRTALGYARTLTHEYPDSASSWFLLALCHGSLTPFKSLTEKLDIAQDVEKNALRSLELDSTYSMTYVLLGIYYRGVSHLSWVERTIVNGILGSDIYGTIEDSERNLRKAVALDPHNSYAYYELSWTLRSAGRESEAIGALRKVLTFVPTNERERQQYESAERRLERMTSDGPSDTSR